MSHLAPLPGAPIPQPPKEKRARAGQRPSPAKSPRALQSPVKWVFERMVFRNLVPSSHQTPDFANPVGHYTFPSPWSTPPPATPHEWTTPVLRGPGRLAAATPEPRARKPKGTPENSPVSFSRLPEVGTPCGHVYAVRRRPHVTCVVLGVFEVRVHRAESRGRDPGEPEADGPKGGCLQDTPENINACSFQRPNGPCRWKPRPTDHSDGFREPKSRRTTAGSLEPISFPTSTTTYTVNHSTNPQHSAFSHSQRLAPPNPSITIPGPPSVPLGYPGPHPPPSSHGVRVCG